MVENPGSYFLYFEVTTEFDSDKTEHDFDSEPDESGSEVDYFIPGHIAGTATGTLRVVPS